MAKSLQAAPGDVAERGCDTLLAGKYKAGPGLLSKAPAGRNNRLANSPVADTMLKQAPPTAGNESAR